jgi:SAM-dependent methyltransferase
LPRDAWILDCACGTGTLALALARYGYSVVAADASEGMVRVAKERAAREGIIVQFQVCPWDRLPQEMSQKFRLALCCGNSIGHCRDEREMLRSLRGMRSVLEEDGLLVIDTRNWEKLLAERPRYTHFGPRIRGGKRCVPIYAWHWLADGGKTLCVDVILPVEQDGKVDLRVYPITYCAFRLADLEARLAEAGFAVQENSYSKECGEYRVVAKKGT